LNPAPTATYANHPGTGPTIHQSARRALGVRGDLFLQKLTWLPWSPGYPSSRKAG